MKAKEEVKREIQETIFLDKVRKGKKSVRGGEQRKC